MKKIYLTILIIIIGTNVFSQNNIQNIRVTRSGDYIHIYYDLTKSKGSSYYSIIAEYSLDGGQTYSRIKNGSGDIGEKVSYGKNKKIIWDVTASTNGIIASIDIRLKDQQYYSGTSLFINYSNRWDLDGLIDEFLSGSKVMLGLSLRKKGYYKGYLITYLSAFKNNYYESENISTEDWEYSENYKGLSGGIGYMTRNKLFSIWVGAGVSRYDENFINRIDHFNDWTITDIGPLFEVGIMFKILGPISIPINYSMSHDSPFISVGLGLIF
ncbi:MAG: hypothetical protein M0P27_03000 [Bacteroidales bacterium]|nr:hypothetical protein [Bacteroidales bacterium]